MPTFESASPVEVTIEDGFQADVPADFIIDPFAYFEKAGSDIQHTETERDKSEAIVRDLPSWGATPVVGKKVNVEKSQVGKSGDPFYEVGVMKTVRERGFVTATPVAMASQEEEHLIVMTRIEGVRANREELEHLKEERSLTDVQITGLIRQADEWADRLQKQMAEVGIIRKLAPKDMIFQLDPAEPLIVGAVPIDWERTKIVDIPE